MTNEILFNVTYKMKGQIVDRRGLWAERLSEHFDVPNWGIGPDGIVVRNSHDDADIRFQAAVDSRQCSLLVREADSTEGFATKSKRLLEWLFKQPEFGGTMHVHRVGVRFRALSSYKGTFATLRSLFETNYLTIKPRVLEVMGATELVDLGAPLNFKDDFAQFNTHCGPVEQAQARLFFPYKKEADLPKIGLYFDNDYFRKPEGGIRSGYLEEFIADGASRAWQRFGRVSNLVFEGESKIAKEQKAPEKSGPTNRTSDKQAGVFRRLLGSTHN